MDNHDYSDDLNDDEDMMVKMTMIWDTLTLSCYYGHHRDVMQTMLF